MTITLRAVSTDEFAALAELDAAVFGYRPKAEDVDYLRSTFEPSRTVCAFEGDRMVASSVALNLELTLPGGSRVQMAGLTWMAVRPTHRRQGLMRRLMMAQLEAVAARNEPVAGLMASESLLYHRFGFGIASHSAHVEIESRHAALRTPIRDAGTIVAVDLDTFLQHVIELHMRASAERNGMVSRSAGSYRQSYRHAAEELGGAAPAQLYAHRDHVGIVDGVVSFRIAANWEGPFPNYELRISYLLAITAAAEIALWGMCLGHDLVTRVVANGRPVDEPIVDLLADPRRWIARPLDELYLRPTNIPTLLAARRYAREGAVVIELCDEVLPSAGGRFLLEATRDAAACLPTNAPADLVLGPAALGAAILGDTPIERLWRAGLVEERTSGAVSLATSMLRWSPAPWASYVF